MQNIGNKRELNWSTISGCYASKKKISEKEFWISNQDGFYKKNLQNHKQITLQLRLNLEWDLRELSSSEFSIYILAQRVHKNKIRTKRLICLWGEITNNTKWINSHNNIRLNLNCRCWLDDGDNNERMWIHNFSESKKEKTIHLLFKICHQNGRKITS